MLTGLPALRDVLDEIGLAHRNAGVCSTSTTAATSFIGVYSCTSVSTGTPIWRLTSARMRRPSSMPGPRMAADRRAVGLVEARFVDERDAELAGDLLELAGGVEGELLGLDDAGAGDQEQRLVGADFETAELHRREPATRNAHHRRPRESRDPVLCSVRRQSKRWVPAFAGMTIAGARPAETRAPSRHRFLRKPRRFPIRLLLARRADEADEQRMPVARRRGELRMELARQEPRMVRRARPSRRAGRPSTCPR